MKRIVLLRQRQLFEAPSHKNVVVLPTVNREEVVQLLSKLLGEIAQADHSKGAEADDDEDRREHLSRGAYVYIRQSTADQLQHNPESRRRQYALAERAHNLGFAEVVVIDDDLGMSGSGVSRPGFDRLLAAICRGTVGAVVSIEASRLARNGRDWHTLLEFCALVGSLIVDEDGVYDPRSPNDRLLLGMKGTLSEMELSLLRQRSMEALKLKAARGDLHTTVAMGYVRGPGDRIEQDPDLRIREAIALVFRKFGELHSVRQVLLWLRQEAISSQR